MCVDIDFRLFNDYKSEKLHLRLKKKHLCSSYKVFSELLCSVIDGFSSPFNDN